MGDAVNLSARLMAKAEPGAHLRDGRRARSFEHAVRDHRARAVRGQRQGAARRAWSVGRAVGLANAAGSLQQLPLIGRDRGARDAARGARRCARGQRTPDRDRRRDRRRQDAPRSMRCATRRTDFACCTRCARPTRPPRRTRSGASFCANAGFWARRSRRGGRCNGSRGGRDLGTATDAMAAAHRHRVRRRVRLRRRKSRCWPRRTGGPKLHETVDEFLAAMLPGPR